MKGLIVALVLMLAATTARAQAAPASYSIWDVQHRLTVGGRFYRSFDEKPGLAGSYSSSWWAGVPASYALTGKVKTDGSPNPIPCSLIGALDVGLQGADQRRIRGYVGVAFLFKGTE